MLKQNLFIDDRDEVHDPFCDMHLFLSGKITKFLQNISEETTWSPRIQNELLRFFHTEFKEHFPTYRLAGPCLKKVFEKVTYFRSWLTRHAHLMLPNGTINTDALIRYHLKRPKTNRKEHPYMCASRIAYKVAECIATCEGKRPSIESLTKRVWSAYKNMLCAPFETSFDDVEDIDRFIVKMQTDLLAEDPLLSEKKLRIAILDKMHFLTEIPVERFSDEATLVASYLLARSKPYYQAHTEAEQKALKKFVRCQREIAHPHTHICEVGRRLLALYPLAIKLSYPISEDKLRAAIHYIYALSCGRILPVCPILDPSIYALLNAQVISLIGRVPLPSQAEVTDHLLKLFDAAKNLPLMAPFELESTLWLTLVDSISPSPFVTFIEEILADTFLQCPELSFETLVRKTVQTLQQTKQTIDHFMQTCSDIDGRIRAWSVQGAMVHRWLTFTPFNSSIKAFESFAKKHQVIADQCAFYRKANVAPIEQLKTWHTDRLRKLYPYLPAAEINQKVKALTRRQAPLCP